METYTKVMVIVTLLVLLIDNTFSIKCYRCTVLPNASYQKNETERMCSKFEETKHFIVDCPFSTMCKKRQYLLQLLDGTVQTTVSRGCANQKNDEMTYENGKWIKKSSVEEVYPEGCQKSGDGSEYCHCRGSLCNSATKLNDSKMSYHTDAMAVIFVFNLMKYIKNMEFY